VRPNPFFKSGREVLNLLVLLALGFFLPGALVQSASRRFPLVDAHEPGFVGVGLAALILGGAVVVFFRRRIFGGETRGLVIALCVVGFAIGFTWLVLGLLQTANAVFDRGKPQEQVVGVLRRLPPSTLLIEEGSGTQRKSRWLEGRDMYLQVGSGGAIALTVMPGALGWPWILDKHVRVVGDLTASVGEVRPRRSASRIIISAAVVVMIIWFARRSQRA